jgi:uncharacterized protein YbjT (DUF2867 family)
MTQTILVTGGTGTLGRHVVPLLRDTGATVRVLSRHHHDTRNGVAYATGDLASGEGVAAALRGVETVVNCAGSPQGDEVKARNLVEAASAAGVRHLVNVSVVGADRVPVVGRVDRAMFGYFAMKLATERVVEGSRLAWTTLRAAQFYDLTLTVVGRLARLPVVPIPSGMKFQPVDSEEVAVHLVELALGPPAGLVPDLAGPRVYDLGDLLRSYLRARGKRRPIVPVRIPGAAAAAIRAGATLAHDGTLGRRTWEDFLAERVSLDERNADGHGSERAKARAGS